MIYIINGPSGSGKTTLGDFFKEKGLEELVSTTTRQPREGEEDGISYHFVTEEEFDKTDLIESSLYSGNRYGLSRKEVEDKIDGGSTFATLDINGVISMKELYGDRVTVIYIMVSKTKLKSRMLRRGDPLPKVLERIRYNRTTGEDLNYRYADYIIRNDRNLNHLYRQGLKVLRAEGEDV